MGTPRVAKDATKVEATAKRLSYYLLYGFSAQAVLLNPRAFRSTLRVTYKGAQYEAIVRVCNGEVQVFQTATQIDDPDKFPLRKRTKGVEQVKKILDRVMANGVCPKWKAEQDVRLAAEAAQKAELKRVKAAITRTRNKILKSTGFPEARLTLTDVTPTQVGSITLKGPWTPDEVSAILRNIVNEGLA